MKERPILFSGPMVRAILDGRKTQTRRVIKPQPVQEWQDGVTTLRARAGEIEIKPVPGACPYGEPGDRLYVKEACWMWGRWREDGKTATGRTKFRFDVDPEIPARFDKPSYTAKRNGESGWVYRHARFMPRWASRITLEVTGVRVERVSDISEADALADGVPCDLERDGESAPWGPLAVMNFARLWDSINAARGYGWDANPWVWVVEFRRVDPDQIPTTDATT